MYQRASSTLAHLKEVAEYAKRFGVRTKIYINPLNSLKESFYIGGILFSCVYDKKVKDIFAAGGRYDHLIKEQRPKIGGHSEERHAVGFSLAWERLARTPKAGTKSFLKKQETDARTIFAGRRVSWPRKVFPARMPSADTIGTSVMHLSPRSTWVSFDRLASKSSSFSGTTTSVRRLPKTLDHPKIYCPNTEMKTIRGSLL